ncbi:uncharacterized protein LOC119798903 [Cyprinodon tularosa]|uniref:uncharacterized protein LOC119798903 n=1 Tax=Cyprinodon tularosa TaxID=77115 RepID=UPI0018E24D81|nr:uncharacterized protein LOC119798903 [Cyprinodon tularosa]
MTKSCRLAWIAAVRRQNITFHSIPMSMRVCSLHFHSGKPANEMYTSHPDWAPSLHLGHTEIKATQTARYERQEKRKRQRTDSTPAMDETAIDDLVPPVETPAPAEDGAEQTPLTECDFCQRRRAEINRLLEENRTLKRELGQRKMDEDFLKEDTGKVKYYTGLPHLKVNHFILVFMNYCIKEKIDAQYGIDNFFNASGGLGGERGATAQRRQQRAEDDRHADRLIGVVVWAIGEMPSASVGLSSISGGASRRITV